MKHILIILSLLLPSVQAAIGQVSISQSSSVSAHDHNPTSGLRKAGPDDIDPSKPLMLDPSSTPIYYEDWTKVTQAEFMKAMMGSEFVPEPYIDSAKEVRAFVLRKATNEEKAQMNEMQARMMDSDQEKSTLIGKDAIPFSVRDILGNSYSSKELKGKIIVVNFWFVECKPCVMEIPELNGLVDKYAGKDVVFLGLATNDQSRIETFIKTQAYKYHLIPSSRDVAAAYEVMYYPTHLIIDKNSKVAYHVTGLGPTTISDLDATIDTLLKQ